MSMSRIISVTMAGKEATSGSVSRAFRSTEWCDYQFLLDNGFDTPLLFGHLPLRVTQATWTNDFADMRNKLIAESMKAFPDADWAFMLDSDEEAVCQVPPEDLRKALETVPPEVQTIYIEHESRTYCQPRFFRLPAVGHFAGKTHEAYNAGQFPWARLEGLVFRDFEKTPEQYKQKFERDLKLLGLTLAEDPYGDNARAKFYLGETYRNLGRYEESKKAYEACARVSQWWEEKAWALYRLAWLHFNTTGEMHLASSAAQRAVYMNPQAYPEAYCLLGEIALRDNEPDAALKCAELALKCQATPVHRLLFKDLRGHSKEWPESIADRARKLAA